MAKQKYFNYESYESIENRVLNKIDNYYFLIELEVESDGDITERVENIRRYQKSIRNEENFLINYFLSEKYLTNNIIRKVYEFLGYKVVDSVSDKNYKIGGGDVKLLGA